MNSRVRYLSTLLLIFSMGSCGGPDITYIDDFSQFFLACMKCDPCRDGGPNMCVKEGQHCESLCPGPGAQLAGLPNNRTMCRCIDSNTIWIFDDETHSIVRKKAPIDEMGNEI